MPGIDNRAHGAGKTWGITMAEEVKQKKKRRVIKHRKLVEKQAAPALEMAAQAATATEQRIEALGKELAEAIEQRRAETMAAVAVAEPEPITPAVDEKPEEKADLKAPKQSYSKWLMLVAGIVAMAAGIGIGILWMQNQRNQMLALATIGLFAGGAYLIYRQLKPQEKGAVIVVPGSTGGKVTKKAGPVNSFNIYAYRDKATGKIFPEKLAFEWIEQPSGQPWQCLNTDKWYYVHIWDIEKQALVPFVLPDAKYTDPSLLARYLELPAEKKYFKHRDSLMHYVGPAIMGVMVGVGFLVMIILGG